MNMFAFSMTFAIVGTSISSLFGGWDMLLQILVFFMVLDYATGVGAAIRSKQLNSEVIYWGGFRKAAMLAVVAVASMFDALVAGTTPVFRTMAIYFYLSHEGVSILENMGRLGVTLPAFLRDILQQLKKRGGDNNG